MKLKYGIVSLLLNYGSICLAVALPTTLDNFPILEAIKEPNIKSPNKTEIVSNNISEFSEKIVEASHSNSSKECDKNEKILQNLDDLKRIEILLTSMKKEINSEMLKDFENNYWPLEQRMPEITEEEFSDINKEGATPWNFLKNMEENKEIPITKPDTKPNITQMYINIPIVINTDKSIPISLRVGGQHLPLKETSETIATINPLLLVKLNDVKEAGIRETNRHRSNIHTKIYALNKS